MSLPNSATPPKTIKAEHVELIHGAISGNTLSIKASGTLSEKIEDGAKVRLQVKYGLITLIKQEASLCDYVKEVNLECPLEKGDLELTKDVDLPKEIPPVSFIPLCTQLC